MNLNTKKWEKVKYLWRNWHDWERKFANQILKVWEVYTVEELKVWNRSSEVTLEWINTVFNSVMFENVLTDTTSS